MEVASGIGRPINLPLGRSIARAINGYAQGGGVAPVYPLDVVTGAAFAYSTKKLASAYSGPAIRVVRPSDSAELDIGFDGVVLDVAAYNTFMGVQAGRVMTWYDQTGNGRHATQAVAGKRAFIEKEMTIGGGACLQFVSGFFDIPSSFTANRASVETYTVMFPQRTVGDQMATDQIGTGGDYLTKLLAANGKFQLIGAGALSLESGYQAQIMPTINYMQSSPTYIKHGHGGELMQAAFSLTPVATVGGFVANLFTGGYEGKAFYACHIAFSGNLTLGQQVDLRSSLDSVFGTTSTVEGRLMFDGDSIADAGAANYYGFNRQSVFSKTPARYSFAGGGNQIQNIASLFTIGTNLSYYSAENRVVVLHAGTNDLTLSGRTDAQIYADIQTYCGKVRTAGGKVVVTTILPNQSWTGPQQATRNSLNTSIRTNWASFADGLADFAADSTMGPQAAASDLSLYPDGLHPSRLGYTYLTPLVVAAVNPLL